jgi:undecaprenyl diphosphate synthase
MPSGAEPTPTFDPEKLPGHVAIIMDGNGRWAHQRGLPRIEGHREGAKSVRDIVRASRAVGLPALTLYAFSSQNWQRPADEVTALMQLLRDYLLEERPEIMDNDIRLTAIGHIDRLPGFVREPLDALVADSAGNRSMELCLALSYGSREAMVDAVRAAMRSGARPEDITVDRLGELQPTRHLPPLDYMIRTSGEHRISNFLLWEAAYAELFFTPVLWPDFRRAQLFEALEKYGGRERRFGLTSEQVRAQAGGPK